MAFRMKYGKGNFPFKKADKTLVDGAKDATETIFSEGDEDKIDIISDIPPTFKKTIAKEKSFEEEQNTSTSSDENKNVKNTGWKHDSNLTDNQNIRNYNKWIYSKEGQESLPDTHIYKLPKEKETDEQKEWYQKKISEYIKEKEGKNK